MQQKVIILCLQIYLPFLCYSIFVEKERKAKDQEEKEAAEGKILNHEIFNS